MCAGGEGASGITRIWFKHQVSIFFLRDIFNTEAETYGATFSHPPFYFLDLKTPPRIEQELSKHHAVKEENEILLCMVVP